MDHPRRQPICAQEALDVLNCVTESSFDQEKCIRLLKSLRECVLNKKVKKFSLSDQNRQETEQTNKEKS